MVQQHCNEGMDLKQGSSWGMLHFCFFSNYFNFHFQFSYLLLHKLFKAILHWGHGSQAGLKLGYAAHFTFTATHIAHRVGNMERPSQKCFHFVLETMNLVFGVAFIIVFTLLLLLPTLHAGLGISRPLQKYFPH